MGLWGSVSGAGCVHDACLFYAYVALWQQGTVFRPRGVLSAFLSSGFWYNPAHAMVANGLETALGEVERMRGGGWR